MSAVYCDHCGRQFIDEDGTGFCAFVDTCDARACANETGWQIINGRDLCPDCYHYDEENDDYVENL